MQSSNLKPTQQNRKWLGGLLALLSLSVGGAFAINNVLNPTTPGASTTGTTSATPQTVTGDAIQYRYGVIQLEITATAGKIDSITEVQASTSGPGYEQAIPLLHDAAISASGTNFGNVSGATFSSDAYKQALSSAIAKLS